MQTWLVLENQLRKESLRYDNTLPKIAPKVYRKTHQFVHIKGSETKHQQKGFGWNVQVVEAFGMIHS